MEGKSKKSKLLKTPNYHLLEKKISGYCGQEIQLFGLLVLDKEQFRVDSKTQNILKIELE
jgi:hypothetical protein